MRTLLLALGLLVAAACESDPVTDRQFVSSAVETRDVSCFEVGYCLTCNPGLDMSFNCGLKFSAFCPGTEPRAVTVERWRVRRQSGRAEIRERVIDEGGGSCR